MKHLILVIICSLSFIDPSSESGHGCELEGSLPEINSNSPGCQINLRQSFLAASWSETCRKLNWLLIQTPENLQLNLALIENCISYIDQGIPGLDNQGKVACYLEYCKDIDRTNITVLNSCYSQFIKYASTIKKTENFARTYLSQCIQDGYTKPQCIASFGALCLNDNPIKSPLKCITLMYSLCRETFPKILYLEERCINKVQLEIGKVLGEICSNEASLQLCVDFIYGMFIEKTIPTNVHFLTASLTALSAIPNATRQTLWLVYKTLLNFKLNEDKIAETITEPEALAFIKIFDTLVGYKRINYYLSEKTRYGGFLFEGIEVLLRLLGKSLLNENGRLEENFSYSGTNISNKLNVSRPDNELSSKDVGYFVGSSMISNYVFNRYGTFSTNETDKYDTVIIPKEKICYPCHTVHNSSTENIYRYKRHHSQEHRCNPVMYDEDCHAVVVTAVIDGFQILVSGSNSTQVISKFITTQIIGMKDYFNQTNDTITFNFNVNMSVTTNDSVKCVYWNTTGSEWSTEGLNTQIGTCYFGSFVRCESNHLTSFAVLIDHQGLFEDDVIPPEEAYALSSIGYIGSTLSLISLLITMFMLICFRKQLDRGILLHVHFNLALSLSLGLAILLGGIQTATAVPWLCSLVSALLHYFFLCAFCWMLCEGITLYILIVKVYAECFFKRLYMLFVIGWGLPLIVVVITSCVIPQEYGNENFCWLSSDNGAIWAFIGPMIFIILLNTVLLALTEIEIIKLRVKARKLNHKLPQPIVISTIKGTIVLLPLLGITWIIGIFAVNENTTVFMWLFTILNSLQGVGILYFHVLRNQNLRTTFRTFFRKHLHLDKLVQENEFNVGGNTKLSKHKQRVGSVISVVTHVANVNDLQS